MGHAMLQRAAVEPGIAIKPAEFARRRKQLMRMAAKVMTTTAHYV